MDNRPKHLHANHRERDTNMVTKIETAAYDLDRATEALRGALTEATPLEAHVIYAALEELVAARRRAAAIIESRALLAKVKGKATT